MECETVCYDAQRGLLCDVYGTGRARLLVVVHGGLWVDGSRADGRRVAQRIVAATEQWTVAVPSYRLSSKENKEENKKEEDKERVFAPEHTADVGRCVAHLLRTLSVQSWAVLGQSCGAHMAALLWLNPQMQFGANLSPPVAVCGVEGMYDNVQFAVDFPDWVGELELSQGRDHSLWLDPTRCSIEEPHAQLKRDCRWAVLHAPADRYVNLRQAELWLAKLREWGVTNVSSYLNLPGDHFSAFRDGEKFPDAENKMCEEILRWLDSVTNEASLERRGIERKLKNAGYRDGMDRGRQEAAQPAFDEGFAARGPVFARLGNLYARVRYAGLLKDAAAETPEAKQLEDELEAAMLRMDPPTEEQLAQFDERLGKLKF